MEEEDKKMSRRGSVGDGKDGWCSRKWKMWGEGEWQWGVQGLGFRVSG